MTRITLIAALAIAPLAAQDWARAHLEKSPRHREWAKIKQGNRAVETFVVYPERKDKAPVIVVIHEIFGLTDWVQDVADQLPEAGFIAIAPDLLSGMAPGGGRTTDFPQGDVGRAIRDLPPDQITADLNAAADYGLKLPAADKKLFVAGFCWGGGQTFRFATNRKDLAAALVFYGPPPDKDAMARIQTPVYGFYGGNDARINATIPDTEARMKELSKTYEPVTYEGAGHGFMRAGQAPDANEANSKARTEAWERIRQILKKH